eukprot:scaffold56494_cov28-Phaeocystis_antarctica.AAC.1
MSACSAMSCRPLRCPPNSVLAAEAPPDAFGIAIGRHATVDSIISVTRLIPCAGAQYVTPAEKNMLLCEAAANGKLMKEYEGRTSSPQSGASKQTEDVLYHTTDTLGSKGP